VTHHLLVAASLGIAWATSHGQGSSFTGRVVTDSGRVPLVGAELRIPALARGTRSIASGEFRFSRVPAGEHIVQIRMPGYAPQIDTIIVADAGEVRREFRLARIQAALPEVPVTATILDRKLADFHERRKFGMGRFLDSAEFAKAHGTRTSDRLARLGGIRIVSGRGLAAYVSSSRSVAAQGKRQCLANVWLDYINLGTGFNVNELDPSIIAAVEWYPGLALPPQFAVPPKRIGDTYCGTLVIWLR
jgi:hypothetical protein